MDLDSRVSMNVCMNPLIQYIILVRTSFSSVQWGSEYLISLVFTSWGFVRSLNGS